MVAISKTVTNACKIHFMTSQKISDFKEIKLKMRAGSKLNWAINAYKDW